jgi:putative cardiolipin synthase
MKRLIAAVSFALLATPALADSKPYEQLDVDRARVFVGSFNFDPRSAHLNTEMGLVIDSPALARRIAESFARTIPQRSYEVRLTPEGDLSWIERNGGEEVRHDTEPNTGFIKRLSVRLLSLLPIDWLL